MPINLCRAVAKNYIRPLRQNKIHAALASAAVLTLKESK
jgi:hypothetical protein